MAQDRDRDGLDDATELALGLDPDHPDSDCDGLDDGREVGSGASPQNTDGDSLIDALESAERDSNLDGQVDELDNDADSVWRIGCARFTPVVITTDNTEPTTIEVSIAGGTGITRVEIGNGFPVVGVTVDGVEFPQREGFIQLFDDGTRGDRRAADGIWSRGNFRIDAVPLPPIVSMDFEQLRVTDATGTTTRSLWQIAGGAGSGAARLGRIDPDLRRSATPADDGFSTTEHVIFLNESLAMIDTQRFLMVRSPPTNMPGIGARVISQFGDRFDFLLFQPAELAVRGNRGLHAGVRNNVSGIGQSVFDSGMSWGSDSRLQSVVFADFDRIGPYIHELTHRWSQSLDPALGFGQCSGGHWGYSGVGTGPVGGLETANLVDNGDGTFTMPQADFSLGGAAADIRPFNQMDLYLAGLISAAEVDPIVMPRNVNCGSARFANGQVTFAADALTTLTIDDVTAAEGPRIPGAGSAQTDFAVGWVVTSARALTPSEYGFFEYQANYLALVEGPDDFRISFAQATGGRASLTTRIRAGEEVFIDGFE